MGLLDLLKLPQVKKASSYDDCSLTLLHREILQQKGFLRKVYEKFYRNLMSHIPEPEKKMLVELGSGAGFIKQLYPNVQTSDVLDLPGLDMVFDAAKMPFNDKTVDGILMINVLHHIKNVEDFFTEAGRVLKETGRVIIIEPANTPWARFIYSRFHHEVFDPGAGWQVQGTSPLMDGNDALAWIIFSRDKKLFAEKFPELEVIKVYCHTPISYLLSGGFTLRQLLPAWMYIIIRGIEVIFQFTGNLTGMFQTIVLEKRRYGVEKR
ncbi:MAG: class I SAM-dependent methyltransferase [Sedimentisphaerales bacterium]|nr:class I SAM-dependent methyltransferase [Sedimentisphaerales bacterium]